jgi:hypothetical protein
MKNNNKNSRYFIQGNNIIKETVVQSVCANANIHETIFNADSNELTKKSDIRPIKGLHNPELKVFYFDNSEVLTRVTVNSQLSFLSTGKVNGSNDWYPTFLAGEGRKTEPTYNWILRSDHGEFLIIENYMRDLNVIDKAYRLMNAKVLYAEQDKKDVGVIHTFAPPFPNIYEDGKLCLGNFKGWLNLDTPFAIRNEILNTGWNADLYRHRNYEDPTEDLTLHSILRIPAQQHNGHGFLRTTSTQENIIASCVMFPQLNQ